MRRHWLVFLVGVAAGCFNPARGDQTGADEETGSTGGGSMSESSGSGSSIGSSGVDSSTATTNGDDTSTGTLPPLPCQAADGEPDPECTDENAPFCLAGVCVGCEEVHATACEDADPGAPACLDGGACGLCEGHHECASGACRFATGECIPLSNALHVDWTAACASADGSSANPYCELSVALEVAAQQDPGSAWAIFVAPGSYHSPFEEVTGNAVAVIGPGSQEAFLTGVDPVLLRVAGGELYVSGFDIGNDLSGGVAVELDGGALHLDDAVLRSNGTVLNLVAGDSQVENTTIAADAALGVFVGAAASAGFDRLTVTNNLGAMFTEGDTTLRTSVIRDNYVEGGIQVGGGRLRVENSYIHDNLYVRGGIQADDGDIEVIYSTIIDEVDCGAANAVTIRNSIVVGLQNCDGAVIDHSAVDPFAVGQGALNLELVSADFPSHFVDPGGSDYHLLGASEIASLAVRLPDDPPADFDGDPRADVDDYDAAGADVP